MKTISALILLLLGAALSVAKAAEGGLSTEMTPTKLSMVTIGTTTNTTTDPAKNMTTSITITVTKTTMMDKETNTMTTILTKTTTETMVTSTQIDNATPQTTMRPIEDPVKTLPPIGPPIPDWTEDHMGTGMPSEPVEMGSTMEPPLPETTVVHVTQSTSVVNDEVDALPKPASTHKPSSGNGPVTSQKTTSTMSILSPSISLSALFGLLLSFLIFVLLLSVRYHCNTAYYPLLNTLFYYKVILYSIAFYTSPPLKTVLAIKRYISSIRLRF
uniref:Expressed conserved protein n=1 Tax=Echinococcus granulosus TaxID=6210 RepID=A0A068WBM2_ECHGR|nr:hypothetical protein EgrG_000740700 [Echinococcus granulosus]